MSTWPRLLPLPATHTTCAPHVLPPRSPPPRLLSTPSCPQLAVAAASHRRRSRAHTPPTPARLVGSSSFSTEIKRSTIPEGHRNSTPVSSDSGLLGSHHIETSSSSSATLALGSSAKAT